MALAMMPWFPGDFLKSTRGWSVTAKGVYRELLDAQWDMGSLPADPIELATMIGASPKEWHTGWAKCEAKFPLDGDGMRRNPRLESHRSKSEDLTERRKEGARKTNAQRNAQRPESDTLSERSASRPAGDGHAHASISDPSPSHNPYPHTHSDSGSSVARAPHISTANGAGRGEKPTEKDSVCVDKNNPEKTLAKH